MSELGQFLKTNREQQGVSLERLQELTKIQKRYLAAIEEGRHDALPGAFYARAFVKSYAEALGLNADEVLETYGSELPQPKQQTSDLPSRTERMKPNNVVKKKKKKSTILPVILVILFVIVVAAAIYLFAQGSGGNDSSGVSPENDPPIEMDSNDEAEKEDSDENIDNADKNDPSASVEQNEEVDKMDEDIEEEKDKTKEPELVSSENRRSVYDVSDFKELVVEVKLNGDSYLDVQDKSGTVIETFAGLEEGESVELDYSDRDYVKINIGNSTVVTVRLNGEVIEYPTGSVHQYLILDRNAQ